MSTEERKELSKVIRFAAYKIMEMRQAGIAKVDTVELAQNGNFPDIEDYLLEIIDCAFTEKIHWRKNSKLRTCISFANHKAFECTGEFAHI